MSTNRAGIEKNNEGMRLLQGGEYEKAVVAFTEAIKLYSGFTGAYRNRAEAYKQLEREHEAERDLEAVASLIQNRRRKAARERQMEGETLSARAFKVRRMSFRLLSKTGTLTIGPSAVIFQSGGTPELRIPAECITRVAPVRSHARLVVEYSDLGTGRLRKVFIQARSPTRKVPRLLPWLIASIPYIGKLQFLNIVRFELNRAEGETSVRDRWIVRLRGLQMLGEAASNEQ